MNTIMPSIQTILESFPDISSLIELDLSYQSLTLVDIEELIKILATNTTLCTLNLSGNHFGNEGFQLLINSLSSITTLLVRDCDITT